MNRRQSGSLIVLALALIGGLLGIGLRMGALRPAAPAPADASLAPLVATGADPWVQANLSTQPIAQPRIAQPAPDMGARILGPISLPSARPVRTLDWQPHAGRAAVPAPATELFVDLPPLTVAAAADGALLAGPVPVADLADLGLTPDLLARLAAADVQHVQIASGQDGFFVESNNVPLLGLAWDGESLARTGQFLAQTGAISSAWGHAAPLLAQINLDIVADLAAVTQRADRPAIALDPAIQLTDPATLAAAAGRESVLLTLPIRYQADGTPRVLGLGALQLELLTGAPFSAAQLTSDQIAALSEAGIREIRLSSEPDGLHIFLNDEPLPTLLWAQGEIGNLVELAAVLIDPEAGEDGEAMVILTDILGMVEQLVRLMQIVNVNVVIQFP